MCYNGAVCRKMQRQFCSNNFRTIVQTILFVPVAVSLQCAKILELDSALCEGLPVSTSAQKETLATLNLVKVAVISVFALCSKVLVAGGYRGDSCENVQEASLMSDRAHSRWLQHGPTAGQG